MTTDIPRLRLGHVARLLIADYGTRIQVLEDRLNERTVA